MIAVENGAGRSAGKLRTSLRELKPAAVLILAPALMLAACTTYQPKPIAPAELAATEPLPDVSGETAFAYSQLLDLALHRSPSIRTAVSNLKAARQDAKAARLQPAITLTLGAEYSKDADAHRPWQYSAAGDIPIDTGARRGARVTSADLSVIVGRNKLADAVWSVRSELVNALIDRADGARAADENALLVAQTQHRYNVSQARLRLGEDAGDVSDLAQVDLIRGQKSLRDATTQRDQANARLAAILHVPIDIAARLKVEYTGGPPSPSVIEDRQGRTVFARSDVMNAITAYDQSESDLRLEVARQYPDIHVGPGYTWERGVVKLPLDVTLGLPTLDRNAANIHAAESRREAAGTDLETTIRQAMADTVQARIDYQAAVDRSAKARIDLSGVTARQARRADANLASGEGDRLDQLVAQIIESNVRIEAVAADGDVARALAKLEDTWRQSADDAENAQLAVYLKSLETGS